MSSDVAEIESRLVLEAINARYGYDFRRYSQPTVIRRLSSALDRSKLAHLGELQHRLLVDPDFFRWLLDQLTVRVSELFRNPSFYRAFRQRVVPLLKTYPLLKMWHAGCASGEEVYSTAIVLSEEGLYERCLLYGTDVSPSAIALAKEGVYDQAQEESLVTNHRASGGSSELSAYYTTAYGRLAISRTLLKNVTFFEHDLGLDHALGEMHVVFCRNVLLYFGQELRLRALELFRDALVRGGFLCLGASEALPPEMAGHFVEFDAENRIYRRWDPP